VNRFPIKWIEVRAPSGFHGRVTRHKSSSVARIYFFLLFFAGAVRAALAFPLEELLNSW
jgi:hypothetical protein